MNASSDRTRRRRAAGACGALLLLMLYWFSGDGHAAVLTWDRADILTAIRQVESSGRPDAAVPDGDGGLAIGPYQIHRVYWLDAIAHAPTIGGGYQDCRRRAYAERIIDAYMRRYAADAWRDGVGEVVARVHNGGPKGHQKQSTERYWQRVRSHLPEPR